MTAKKPKGWIAQEDFSRAVAALPLVSVDLVVINEKNEILLGLRNNRPAKGFWFTPGSRVRKGEPLADALHRVWSDELGLTEVALPPTELMGAWDHFYTDSAFSSIIPTHYVNLPHLIKLKRGHKLDLRQLPSEQHSLWNWVKLEKAIENEDVHEYVRVYARELIKRKT
jgi:colanic acid biosynthesis protein WcaH